MNKEEYLDKRLEDQIDWYSRKSQFNQRWYKRLRVVEIVSASIIPFLAGMKNSIPYSEWIIGGLGVVIAGTATAISIYKLQENWIQYRTTAEILKHEKFLYLTKTTPYTSENNFNLLVQRVESLISKENYQWAMYAKKQEKLTTTHNQSLHLA